ncbi:NATT3 protein, partial [Bucorvus abyssinicus]|nr:NATT3 protein [Bucorvus abyssinicus]
TEFVCSAWHDGCQPGSYVPSRGPFCHFPYGGRELKSPDFKVLVNADNLEALAWVADSFGNVPRRAVEGCPRVDVFVGRNRQALGKVSKEQRAAFVVDGEGEEVWYKWYQVLVVRKGPSAVAVEDVVYDGSAAAARAEEVTVA